MTSGKCYRGGQEMSTVGGIFKSQFHGGVEVVKVPTEFL